MKSTSVFALFFLILGLILAPFWDFGLLNFFPVDWVLELGVIQVFSSIFFLMLSVYLFFYPLLVSFVSKFVAVYSLNFFLPLGLFFLAAICSPLVTIKLLKLPFVIGSVYYQILNVLLCVFFLSLGCLFKIKNKLIGRMLVHFTLFSCLAFTLLSLVDIVAYISYSKATEPVTVKGGVLDYFEKQEGIGYVPTRDTVVNCIKVNPVSGDTVIDVNYTFNNEGLRYVPDSVHSDSVSRHLAFFGESSLFGDGMNDDETLPSVIAQKTSSCHVYNLAFVSYGFQHMLARIQSGLLSKQVKERKGIAILDYTGWQIKRALVSKYSLQYGDWYSVPFYSYSQTLDKGVIGDLFTNRLIKFSYKFFNGSSFFRAIDLPQVSDRLLKHVAQMIAFSAQMYKDQFPGSDFYVLFHPINYNNHPETKAMDVKMEKYLLELNLKILDYRNLFVLEGEYVLPDGHPNKLANELVAKKILKDLNLN